MEDRTRWGDVSAIYYLYFPNLLKEHWNSELRLPTINYLFIVSRTRPKKLCQQSRVFWGKKLCTNNSNHFLFFWRRTIFKGYKFIFFIINIIKYWSIINNPCISRLHTKSKNYDKEMITHATVSKKLIIPENRPSLKYCKVLLLLLL